MTGVPPLSSLIFVIILAVWAVYLVQHWVRRRDHLATARSVDRFSESMRVLERRRALPRPDLSEPAPRSYSVSPLRPARPQVVVKRGEPAPAFAGATAVAPSAAYRRARNGARLRAAALLLGSAAMVTLVGLALAGVLQTWWIFVGIGALALSVSLVRWSVSRGRSTSGTRRTTTAGRSARPAPSRSTAAPAAPHRARRPARQHPASQHPASQHRAAEHGAVELGKETGAAHHAFARQSVAATTRTARRSVRAVALYDIDEVEASLLGAEPPATQPTGWSASGAEVPDGAELRDGQASEIAAGTWEPVAVPPPTYTLKAKAHRGAAAPSPTGATELPADGAVMALDEEYEDLPRVGNAG